ncbi:hypothetical protein [Pseudomonas sp. Hp2]|uniref:hypothetical protein n=1 Tax=Pseudomonas sp. Hp2 TaxID=701189 RepID=UPI00112D4CD4|nr:hypothetical protein [Pseudomonas sp. Hp2]
MGQALEATATTGTLRIHNESQAAKRYQVLVDGLSVGPAGERIQAASADLAFYPSSVVTLKPGATQTLRWKRTTTASVQEKAYLVIIREEPVSVEDTGGVGFKLHYTPRFINPWVFVPPGAKPALSVTREGSDLVFFNRGTATAPLTQMSFAGNPIPGNFLVLPGERFRLRVEGTGREVHYVSRGVAQSLPVD